MTRRQFELFWEATSQQWYNYATVSNMCNVSEYCSIKDNIVDTLYHYYTSIKNVAKESYFKNPAEDHLSRYKRAAVMAYAILLANPIEIIHNISRDGFFDPFYLKQRLAFFVALNSIIQAYPVEAVKKLDKELYDFDSLDRKTCQNGEDGFLISVYRDMFFSEIYKNYNILTMANVFGLITEKCSLLSDIDPLFSDSSKE